MRTQADLREGRRGGGGGGVMNTMINAAFTVVIPRVRKKQLLVGIGDFEREARD